MDKYSKAEKIVVAFDKYSETSDKSLIEVFSLDELMKTKFYVLDKETQIGIISLKSGLKN